MNVQKYQLSGVADAIVLRGWDCGNHGGDRIEEFKDAWVEAHGQAKWVFLLPGANMEIELLNPSTETVK